MQEISDVAAERFEAGVGSLGPVVWDLADQQRVGEGFEFRVHDNQTLVRGQERATL